MSTVKYYWVKAHVGGAVIIKPGGLHMRMNDANTPLLEVEVVYLTPFGKQRDFILTDNVVTFEAVTPGGKTFVASSDESEYFNIAAPARGRFSFAFPRECIDAPGNSKLAYFRFRGLDSTVLSTGNFSYTVIGDINTGRV